MSEPLQVGYAQETNGRIEPFEHREWLLANGLGGFASGTVVDVPTRRYHALLIAATNPPVGRVMALSRFVQVLMIDGRRVDFSAARFGGGDGGELHGQGVSFLRRFHLAGELATWEYDVEGISITRELLVCWEQNACAVRYGIAPLSEAPARVSLRLLPLVGLRDFHALLREGEADFDVASQESATTVTRGGLELHITGDAGRFEARPDWWRNFHYPVEAGRGMDCREDLFAPGEFVLDLASSRPATITLWASLGQSRHLDWDRERRRRQGAMGAPRMPTPTQQKLARAAADFVVKRRRANGSMGTSIIAGYPWFADWGRDTFIALPGLLLSTKRHEEAGQVLATFAEHVSDGMIPNRFNDYTNEPEYNTVDASLWFIHAVHEYRRASRDELLYQRLLLPACHKIVEGYTRGTRFGIHVDPADGLVAAGDETTQLTWMDARRDGTVFTPRHGKAVEINALWYNALMLLDLEERADQVRKGFARFVGIQPENLFDFALYDVIDSDRPDRSIRPNQIFAVSLPHSPLGLEEQYVVVEVVRRKLLTPCGVRTLAPGDARYRPRFTGSIFERDAAYHNGTVWPWLIGPFIDAYLKVNQREPAAVEQARLWLRPLLAHLEKDGCLGSISEVFDGDPPQHPDGCFAQAWSVAEVLRLAVELEI